MRAASSMLKLIIVLLYMITPWLDWMKPMPPTAVGESPRRGAGCARTVRCQVEHVVYALAHGGAVVEHAQVHQDELVAEHLLLEGRG